MSLRLVLISNIMFCYPVNGELHQCIKYARLLKCIYKQALTNNNIINQIYSEILYPIKIEYKITIFQLLKKWNLFFQLLYQLSINKHSFYINIINKINDIEQKWKSNIIQFNSSILISNEISIKELPSDILTYCISFLDILEVLNVEKINYKFFNCAHQSNAIVTIDDTLFFRVFHLMKHSIISFYNSSYFKQRFSRSESLYLNPFLLQLIDINVNTSFIRNFTNLKSLTVSTKYISTINVSSIIQIPNVYKQIQYLHLVDCINVDVLLFQCLKNCKLLHDLILSGCCISNDFKNTIYLWKYYTQFQNEFDHLQILKINWFDLISIEHFQLSLTFIRMLIHQNLKCLILNCKININIDAYKYINPPFLINFNYLQLEKLDITTNCLTKNFIYSVIPYMKSLKSLIIRGWCNINDDDNNIKYVSKIIMNNVNNLASISFILDDDEFENIPYFLEERNIWDPILIILKNCIEYPDWSKNVFSKFEFIIKRCIAFQADVYVINNSSFLSQLKFDIDCMHHWLLYYRNRCNELARILQQNNINFVFQLYITFDDYNIFHKYFTSKWNQIFSLLWTIKKNKKSNGFIAKFCNQNIRKQSFITSYFNKIK